MFRTGRWLNDLQPAEVQPILEFIATGSTEWPN